MTAEARPRDAGIRFLLAGACLVVIIAGLRAAAPIILPFLIAVFLAVVNVPLMNWLVRIRVPKPAARTIARVGRISPAAIIARPPCRATRPSDRVECAGRSKRRRAPASVLRGWLPADAKLAVYGSGSRPYHRVGKAE